MKQLSTIILFLLFYGMTFTFAQSINKPYEYPIKPGTVEWKRLKSRKEKGEVCQIPQDILSNLTTEALVETCLKYPLFKDLYFFNDIQTGFNLQKISFNGFQELFSRKGRLSALLTTYEKMNPASITKLAEEAKGDYAFTFLSIEILLSQPECIKGADPTLIKTLKAEALKKYESKVSSGFSFFTTSPSILIVGRLLEKEKVALLTAKNSDIKLFLELGTPHNTAVLESIYASSK